MFDQSIFGCLGQLPYRQQSRPQMTNQHSFHLQTSSGNTGNPITNCLDCHNPEDDDQTGLAFTEINFFPCYPAKTEAEGIFSSIDSSQFFGEDCCETTSCLTTKSGTKSKVPNNAADYIIKHCLKMMLTPKYKGQISSYCEELGICYDHFIVELRRKMEKMPKHIGVNRFDKMIRSGSAMMEVVKYFLTVYLQFDYLDYLLTSSIENKAAYVDCAIKLIYFAQVSKSKAYQLIQMAQRGQE